MQRMNHDIFHIANFYYYRTAALPYLFDQTNTNGIFTLEAVTAQGIDRTCIATNMLIIVVVFPSRLSLIHI